jgi:glycosyltransferase involved in cell wall biosynthesis
MKKIIIVNNNMKVGGVQKALCNLLWEIKDKYDITLCLFSNTGEYADKIPKSVRVIKARGVYRYLGNSQAEFKGIDFLLRGICVLSSRAFGRRKTLRLLGSRQPELDEKYDCAISYLHNGRSKSFYGGTQDFVLNCVNADKKVAFLHCDYRNCGANNTDNNKDMERFDKIAACSDGCRNAFLSVLPDLADKCLTVRNCHSFDEIRKMADEDPVIYDSEYLNLIIVARLSREKGIDRAIRAVANAIEKNIPVRLHIVGGGSLATELSELARELGVSDNVFFYGEQGNPYRYMKNADLLLISSYHEAAPMVIDEAICLGLPILTTETTSSYDMVTSGEYGFVCENSLDALMTAFVNIAFNKEELMATKKRMQGETVDNTEAVEQFNKII